MNLLVPNRACAFMIRLPRRETLAPQEPQKDQAGLISCVTDKIPHCLGRTGYQRQQEGPHIVGVRKA